MAITESGRRLCSELWGQWCLHMVDDTNCYAPASFGRQVIAIE
jgi:hypothetical protein